MSLSRTLSRFCTFVQRRPLLFNSIMYGSFYTAAEFSRQSYNKMFELVEPTLEKINETKVTEGNKPVLIWIHRVNTTLGLVEENRQIQTGYNWPQLKRYGIYGCFLAGPLLHMWYKWLDAFYQGKSMRVVMTKLFADQFILTPPLIIFFFLCMSLMESRSDIFAECRIKFFATFKTSCMYWLPVQFINFLMIPAHLRVTFVSVAAFCWVNILCYLKSIPLTQCSKDAS